MKWHYQTIFAWMWNSFFAVCWKTDGSSLGLMVSAASRAPWRGFEGFWRGSPGCTRPSRGPPRDSHSVRRPAGYQIKSRLQALSERSGLFPSLSPDFLPRQFSHLLKKLGKSTIDVSQIQVSCSLPWIQACFNEPFTYFRFACTFLLPLVPPSAPFSQPVGD